MASPSEFLTFYRRTARLTSLRQSRIVPASPRRTFVSSTCRYSSGGKLSTDDSVATEAYPDSEHATDKKDKLDIQSDTAAKGQEYVFHTLYRDPNMTDVPSGQRAVARVVLPLSAEMPITAPQRPSRRTPRLQM